MHKREFEDVNYELDIDSAPDKVLQWAKDNLGEEDVEIKIYEFREMIFERGDVVAHRTDDLYLLKFLRARSFNLESAYKLLVNYYTFRADNPELHENVIPLDLKFIGDEDIIEILPFRDPDERRIMIIKLGNWNPQVHSMTDIFKGTLIILELGSLEPRAQILGGICILDFKNISVSQAWHVTPSVAKTVIHLMVTSFPLKVHALHITFESKVFDLIYKVFQPFINSKMREKIFFHGSNMESLHAHINPKYLPKRYGGIRPNYRYNRWIEKTGTNPRLVAELKSLGYIITDEPLDEKFTSLDDEMTSSDSE